MTETDDLAHSEASPYMEKDKTRREGLGGDLVTLQVEGVALFQCLVTVPNGPQGAYDFSTLRVKRVGGPTPGDLQYRQNAFTLAGAMTIAAGHIEAEMKRIILVAEELETGGFGDMPSTWSGLQDRLARIVDGEGRYAEPLREVLDWGAERKVTAIRHGAIHSAWVKSGDVVYDG